MFPPLFLVPKKDGGQRPVINLKSLNSFVDAPHFKMEGIHTLKSLVLEGDWLVKVDLKDAYFSVPISQKHRKFLCFQFEDKSYQFNCLPFGLASAPWVFTKTLKPVAALGRELGIRMVVYIDDILLMAETKEKARDQASSLIYLLQCPGFTVNMEKTVLEPGQCLEFLGFMVDTTRMELSLPAQKIIKIRAESRQLLEVERVTARALSRLIGKMNATNPVIPPVPLFYKNLQMDLATALRGADQDYETLLVLSSDSREELTWWDTQMIKWNGRMVMIMEPSLTIESDASTQGWGASHRGTSTGGALVPPGEGMAHKLPRIASGDSSTEDLREEQEGNVGLIEDRQHDCSCLYQQPGGYCIQGVGVPDPGPMDVVSREEHPYPSTISARGNERGGRQGIEIHERSIGLEAGSVNISDNQQDLWPNGSGPVCIQTDQPVPSLLQLAARSIRRGNRCLPAGLDNGEGLCQPSIEPNTEGANESTVSGSRLNPGSPSVEDTTMVPPPTINVSGLATPATQAGHYNRVSTHNAPTSRLEHLKERLSEQGLSGQAADLILKSWRTKTNKSYDSLFGQWNRWCVERGSDSFSGPVSTVANFLASLYQDGYQYNSVNAY